MKNTSTREPVQMLVMPTTRPDSDVIGICGVANRLDEVRRLPGEPLTALVARALDQVRGRGVLLAYLKLRD